MLCYSNMFIDISSKLIIFFVPKCTYLNVLVSFIQQYCNPMTNIPNDYVLKDGKLCFSHDFDKPLKPYRDVMRQTNYLVFGNNFNQKLKLAPNITHLILGNCFNQRFKMGQNILTLEFGNCFNKPLHLTQCLEILIFGDNFNQPLILTPRISILKFGNCFNQPIVLTPNISYLSFGMAFNQKIDLTPNLNYILFGEEFRQTFEKYPKNIETVILDNTNCFSIFLFPGNMSRLTIPISFGKHIEINKKMKYFYLNSSWVESIRSCKNMSHFSVENAQAFRGPATVFNLSKKITHLNIDIRTTYIQLPKHLTHLTLLLGDIKQNMALSNLVQLNLCYKVGTTHNIQLEQMCTGAKMLIEHGEHKLIDGIPNGVNVLRLRWVKSFDNLPNSIKKFDIGLFNYSDRIQSFSQIK